MDTLGTTCGPQDEERCLMVLHLMAFLGIEKNTAKAAMQGKDRQSASSYPGVSGGK